MICGYIKKSDNGCWFSRSARHGTCMTTLRVTALLARGGRQKITTPVRQIILIFAITTEGTGRSRIDCRWIHSDMLASLSGAWGQEHGWLGGHGDAKIPSPGPRPQPDSLAVADQFASMAKISQNNGHTSRQVNATRLTTSTLKQPTCCSSCTQLQPRRTEHSNNHKKR